MFRLKTPNEIVSIHNIKLLLNHIHSEFNQSFNNAFDIIYQIFKDKPNSQSKDAIIKYICTNFLKKVTYTEPQINKFVLDSENDLVKEIHIKDAKLVNIYELPLKHRLIYLQNQQNIWYTYSIASITESILNWHTTIPIYSKSIILCNIIKYINPEFEKIIKKRDLKFDQYNIDNTKDREFLIYWIEQVTKKPISKLKNNIAIKKLKKYNI